MKYEELKMNLDKVLSAQATMITTGHSPKATREFEREYNAFLKKFAEYTQEDTSDMDFHLNYDKGLID